MRFLANVRTSVHESGGSAGPYECRCARALRSPARRGAPRSGPRACAGHAVNLVEAGSFRVRTNGAWHQVAADRVFVTTPALEFSCAHDEDHPADCCLSVSYSEQAMESARSSMALRDSLVRPLTNRQAFLRRALRDCGRGDEARTEALAGALLWSLSNGITRHPLFTPDRLAWHAARVGPRQGDDRGALCRAALAVYHGSRRRG